MEESLTKVIADTVHVATESNSSDTGWILHHILDSKELFGFIPLPQINLFGIDLSLTQHSVFMFIASALLITFLSRAARAYKKSLVPKGFNNLLEILVIFVRDDIAKPSLGKGYEKFLPYLLTVFFFILTCNFLGLIPFGATATSNISVTATLAVLSFLVIQAGGIIKNGFFGYFKGLLPHGLPVLLTPLMLVVELLGLFTKPFALAIRLFANMTAGHIIILSLIGVMFILQSYGFAPISIAFALFINLLEILVALIQAYIFTMLSSLFIGMAVHQEH